MKLTPLLISLFLAQTALALDCISTFQMRNWTAESDEVLMIETRRAQYRLELFPCSELRWAQRIGFDSFGSRVCRGDKVLVLDNWSNRVLQSCPIRKIEEL